MANAASEQRDDLKKLDRRTDSVLSEFDDQFARIQARAQARVTSELRDRLEVDPRRNVVRLTGANVRAVQQLPAMYSSAMSREGYPAMLGRFASSFDGGLPTLESVLDRIADRHDLGDLGGFSAQDVEYFDQVKAGAVVNLRTMVDQVGQAARRSVQFTVAGRPFADTAAMIAEKLGAATGEASTLAATGISTFYRTITARGFERIESELEKNGKELTYSYFGPLDKLTRPFCERLSEMARSGRTWTREQIDRMDNGQLDDVFTTCGGWNCRHQWVVALD